jgi:hypothetical protein
VHEPLPSKAEAFQMAVVGEDHLVRIDAVLCRPDRPPAAFAREFDYRRILVDSNTILAQAACKSAHIARRLQHSRARRKKPRHVVPAAGELDHRLGIQHLAHLAKTLEMLGIAAVEAICLGAGRAIHLASRIKIGTIDVIVLNRRTGEGDGSAVESDHLTVAAYALPGIIRGRDIVGQIDHEAGIAPGCTFSNASGFEHGDFYARSKLQQTSCGRKPSKACADDREIRVHVGS